MCVTSKEAYFYTNYIYKRIIKSIIKDTVIDGKSQTNKTVKPVIDSLDLKKLEDNPEAVEIDEKWLEELYSSSLFETIYKSISELEYEEVYYPELPTDTLKKRLKETNMTFQLKPPEDEKMEVWKWEQKIHEMVKSNRESCTPIQRYYQATSRLFKKAGCYAYKTGYKLSNKRLQKNR